VRLDKDNESAELAIFAGLALFGGAQPPLTEAGLEFSTEQKRNHPAAEQKQELEGFDGHRRQISGSA
jgi:hypothetical protein